MSGIAASRAVYLALESPNAHVLFVELLLLKSDALHQVIDTFVLGL